MLGHKLYQELGQRFDVYGTVRGEASELDVYKFYDPDKIIGGVLAEDVESVRRALGFAEPEVVINAIGLVKQLVGLDTQPMEVVNSVFPKTLAALTAQQGSKLFVISTDCVFSGKRGNYTESDIPDASDPYGVSKLSGEVIGTNVLTLRTSIVGRELRTQHGLVEWFLSQRGKEVKGYVNAIFSGVTTIAFARIIETIIVEKPDLQGLWHVSSSPISKYDLLSEINRIYAADVDIVHSSELDIDRSLNSTRFRRETGLIPIAWPEMISEMAADRTPYDEWHTQ
jgi:dTDP-4-dehydrorhamnose reductase